MDATRKGFTRLRRDGLLLCRPFTKILRFHHQFTLYTNYRLVMYLPRARHPTEWLNPFLEVLSPQVAPYGI